MINKSFNNIGKALLKVIAGLLVVGLLVLLTTGLWLKKGIRIDNFSVDGLTVSGFSLVWKKRLELDVDILRIGNPNTSSDFLEVVDYVRRGVDVGASLSGFISRVAIKKVIIEGLGEPINIDLKTDQQPWRVVASSRNLNITSDVIIGDGTLTLDVQEAKSKRFKSSGTGRIIIDAGSEQISGTLSVNLGGSLPVQLDFKGDKKQLAFQGREAGMIHTITEFVDLFTLDQDIQPWVTEYLKGSRYTLKTFQGTIPWDDPAKILTSLYSEVRVDDCRYTFAPGLEPIQTEYTDVVFHKGVLTIRPHGSTFYGQSAEESWLDIDFNDPDNIILTAYITTHATLNDDILTLLGYYDIDLPFKQIEGKTSTDLILAVNLNEESVTAKGTFTAANTVFQWDKKTFQIAEIGVSLKDSDVAIDQLDIGMDDIVDADVTGNFSATDDVGDLNIVVKRFLVMLGDSQLSLRASAPPPVIHYHIRPDGHSLEASESSWMLDSLELDLAKLSAPVSFDKLSAHISPTLLTSPVGLATKIGGTFSLSEQIADLKGELTKYQTSGMQLKSPSLPYTVQYQKMWVVRAAKESFWDINDTPVTLPPSELQYADNIVAVKSEGLQYGTIFKSSVFGNYNNSTHQGVFTLENFMVTDNRLGVIDCTLRGTNKKFTVDVPELGLKINGGLTRQLTATFSDLGLLHQRSKLLQRLRIDKGNLMISSSDGKAPYNFTATVPYDVPLLVKGETPVEVLNISGTVSQEKTSATINGDVQVDYTENIAVRSKGVAYNIPEIITLLKEPPGKQETPKKKGVRFLLEAKDSSLYFRPGNEALADTITLVYVDGSTVLRLEHGEGSVDIDITRRQFSLEGKKLNDVFMAALARGADFRSGEMSVAARGSFDEYSVLFTVNNAILERFTILNNILAFLNTVPALVTFSLPEYVTGGLPVTSAVVGMVVKDGRADVKSFDIKSPELTMSGTGWVNIIKNTIDMDFNLITKAKKNISKIPLLGYIMVGEKKLPSITVNVTGDLDDPRVNHSIFREVSSIPFSILYRTLTLPFEMVEPMYDSMKEIQDIEYSFPFGAARDEHDK